MSKTIFNPLDFSEKKIMITGASSGIGQATAIYLSKLGAQLVLIGRNEENLNSTLIQLANEKKHIVISVDLAEVENMKEVFVEAVKDSIKLDGLVHAAGVPHTIPLKSLTKKRMLETFNINYFAFLELCKQYEKAVFSNGGSIVGISSIASDRGEKCQTVYSATKAALDASVQTLSLELAKKNIRINSILPGVVKTSILGDDEGIDQVYEDLAKTQLLGVGKPEDIAGPIAFLLSDMSKFITGRQLYADGGRFL